jgi:hypothetical protein
MGMKKALIPVVVCALLSFACAYIVLPPELEDQPTPAAASGWTAVVTSVGQTSAGDLHIDLTLQNTTGQWSSMHAVTTGHAAVLTAGGGATTNCDTLFVNTGGNYLAPGFQMRGYTGGTKAAPKTQLLYVECKGAAAAGGSKLAIDYTYVTGAYNYYVASAPVSGRLELDLDKVVKDLQYPIATPVKGLIEKPGDKIVAINKCILTLTEVKRTDTGLELSWQTNNPGAYPTYVHIGTPPVIGSDGILYGFYGDPTLTDAPITLPGDKADWTSTVDVPKDVSGLYVLVSVESKQQKNFVSHAIDIGGK